MTSPPPQQLHGRLREDERVRWRTGYEPDGDNDPEEAIVEASTSAVALHRLREVVGTDTDVIYVIPERGDTEASGATYEDFLTDTTDPRA